MSTGSSSDEPKGSAHLFTDEDRAKSVVRKRSREELKEKLMEQEMQLACKLEGRMAGEALEIPANMKPAEKEAWSRQVMTDLLPEAAQQIAFRIRRGSRNERYEAAKDLLRGKGILGDPRQGAAASAGPVLLISGLDAGKLPWGGIVDGKVVASKAGLPADAPVRGDDDRAGREDVQLVPDDLKEPE